MKLKVFFIICMSFSCLFAGTADENQVGDIVVHLQGFKSDQGMVMLALHNTKKTFLKKDAPFRGQRVKIKNKEAQYTFENVPYGQYSVAVFHDENNNGDLDANFLGIPKEEYGFSNNAWKKFGPPSYKQTVFFLNEQEKVMTINIRSGIEKE